MTAVFISLAVYLLLLIQFSVAFFYMNGCGHSYHSRFGSLFSPTYSAPNQTRNPENCKWRITAAPGEKIVLNITDIDIIKSVDCHQGYVEVRDGYWLDSPFLGKFCGHGQLDPVESSSNKMLISYVVQDPNGHRGFSASYEAICGEELFIEETTPLESPLYPEMYPLNKKCVWKIRVPENRKVVLKFHTFDLEDQSLFDYLEVRDGLSLYLLGRYCGRNMPPELISSSNSLEVKFVSDSSVRRNGFAATIMVEYDECATSNHQCAHGCVNTLGGYKCICRLGFELQTNGRDCETACGGIVDYDNGTITSPSFPNQYPPNKTCIWEIVTQPMNIITLNFTDFELQNENLNHPKGIRCDKDRLEVYNRLDEEVTELEGIYCGTELPDEIYSKSNRMKIVFFSDGTIERSGFSIDFSADLDRCGINNGNCLHKCLNTPDSSKCVCNPNYAPLNDRDCLGESCNYEISSFSGTFASPNYPSNYPPGKNCRWIFTTTPGHRINVVFDAFLLEGNCGYDAVTIYNGPSTSNHTLVQSCGSNRPPAMTSSGNQLLVTFKSDGSNQYQGFHAKYKVVCGATLQSSTSEQYMYSHPAYGTTQYDNGTDCEWIISPSSGYNTTLLFLRFDLENSADCTYDYVEIYTGVNTNATSVGKFCGTLAPSTLTSNKGFLIRFHSDSTVSSTGFGIIYRNNDKNSSVKVY